MRFALAVLLVLGLLLGLSCDDPAPTPMEPQFQVGALEGYVHAGGAPVDGEVAARLMDFPGSVVARTQIDSTGWYRLELPADSYRIQIHSLGDVYLAPDPSGVVRVDARVQRHDFIYGKLTVRLTAPGIPEALSVRCKLECADGSCHLSEWESVRDGRLEYDFRLVSPGAYRIGLEQNSRASIWLPDASDPDGAEVVTIPADRPFIYEGSLDQHASISGSVHGSWEELAFGRPTVTAVSLDSTDVGFADVTLDGTFLVHVLVARSVRLRVDFFGVPQWVGGDTFDAATVFALQPGQHVEGVSVVESGIQCELTYSGGEPVTGAGLIVRDESGRTLAVNPSSRNPVFIPNLRPGRYFVYTYGSCQFDGQTWATQWYEDAESYETATPIDLPPGQLVPISISLVEGASIEGTLVKPDGQPTGGPIWVTGPEGIQLCGRYTYQDGAFALHGFGNGDYYIATRFLDETWWYPGTLRFELAEPIKIRDRASVRGVELRLPL